MRRLRGQRFVGAAQVLGDARVPLRKPAHVHLVDDRVVPRRARRPIVAPGERGIDDGGERRERRRCRGRRTTGRRRDRRPIAEHLVGPANRTRHRLRVWIHDNLVRVETVALPRLVRAVDAVTVELVRPDVGQEAVPDHVGLLRQARCGPISFVASSESNRHSSTLVACAEKSAKLTPTPVQVAPRG